MLSVRAREAWSKWAAALVFLVGSILFLWDKNTLAFRTGVALFVAGSLFFFVNASYEVARVRAIVHSNRIQ